VNTALCRWWTQSLLRQWVEDDGFAGVGLALLSPNVARYQICFTASLEPAIT
jgi:hypothetical protein